MEEIIANALHTSENYEEWAGKFFNLLLTVPPSHEICQMILNGFVDSHIKRDYYNCFATWLGSTNKDFRNIFEEMFKNLYEAISSRNVELHRIYEEAKFFARLIHKDSISWDVLSCIQLKSSSVGEYFVTLLLLELSENFGKKVLCRRLEELKLRNEFKGLFPKDNPENTRSAITIFESLDLHSLTHDLYAYINEEELNSKVQNLSL